MKSQNLATGIKGEEIAAQYLQKQGFQIIDRNWKIKFGEVDIVAVKDNTTYFIEVKTQFEKQQTSPEDELTHTKINKLKNLARMYIMSHQNAAPKMMLAAICIVLKENIATNEIRFIENILE